MRQVGRALHFMIPLSRVSMIPFIKLRVFCQTLFSLVYIIFVDIQALLVPFVWVAHILNEFTIELVIIIACTQIPVDTSYVGNSSECNLNLALVLLVLGGILCNSTTRCHQQFLLHHLILLLFIHWQCFISYINLTVCPNRSLSSYKTGGSINFSINRGHALHDSTAWFVKVRRTVEASKVSKQLLVVLDLLYDGLISNTVSHVIGWRFSAQRLSADVLNLVLTWFNVSWVIWVV